MFNNFFTYLATVIVPALLWPVISKVYKHITAPTPVKINRRLRILNKHCDEYLTVEDQYRSHKDEEYIAYKKIDAVMRCVTGVENGEEREVFKKIDMKCNGRVNIYHLRKILKYISFCDDNPNLKFKEKKLIKDRSRSRFIAILSIVAMVIFIVLSALTAYRGDSLYNIATCFIFMGSFEVVALINFSKDLSSNDVNQILVALKAEGVYEDIEYTD